MIFQAPALLATLTVPVMLLAAYGWRQRQRRRHVLAFTDLATIEEAVPRRPRRRRHAGACLILLAAATLAVATARPTLARTRTAGWVYLAIDVSLSMAATDVAPSRLESARAAARAFLDAAPDDVAVGLVTFAGDASVAVVPTGDRLAVSAALDAVRLRAGTATGDAILVALDDLAARGDAGASDGGGGPADGGVGGSGAAGRPPAVDRAAGAEAAGGGAAGGGAAAHIVLLSDGERTAGADPLAAAERAASAGVRVSAVALGTAEGVIDVGGAPVPVPVDLATLQRIAERSGGSATQVTTSEQLRSVFTGLARRGAASPDPAEVTHVFAVAGLLLLALGAVALGRWGVVVP